MAFLAQRIAREMARGLKKAPIRSCTTGARSMAGMQIPSQTSRLQNYEVCYNLTQVRYTYWPSLPDFKKILESEKVKKLVESSEKVFDSIKEAGLSGSNAVIDHLPDLQQIETNIKDFGEASTIFVLNVIKDKLENMTRHAISDLMEKLANKNLRVLAGLVEKVKLGKVSKEGAKQEVKQEAKEEAKEDEKGKDKPKPKPKGKFKKKANDAPHIRIDQTKCGEHSGLYQQQQMTPALSGF